MPCPDGIEGDCAAMAAALQRTPPPGRSKAEWGQSGTELGDPRRPGSRTASACCEARTVQQPDRSLPDERAAWDEFRQVPRPAPGARPLVTHCRRRRTRSQRALSPVVDQCSLRDTAPAGCLAECEHVRLLLREVVVSDEFLAGAFTVPRLPHRWTRRGARLLIGNPKQVGKGLSVAPFRLPHQAKTIGGGLLLGPPMPLASSR